MQFEWGRVVCSIAGRDAGVFFAVVGVDNDYVLVANGRLRKLEKAKRKNIKHLRWTNHKLTEEQMENNKQLHQALSQFKPDKNK